MFGTIQRICENHDLCYLGVQPIFADIFGRIAVSVEKTDVYSTALAPIMVLSPFGWSCKKLRNGSTLQTSNPQ